MESDGQFFLDVLKQHADPDDLNALLSACVGRRIYVAFTGMGPDNWIATAIGLDKGRQLLAKLHEAGIGGGEIEVPIDGSGVYTLFHKTIADLVLRGVRQGKTVSAIASEIGITERAVRMQRRKMKDRGILPRVNEIDEYINRYFRVPYSFDANRQRTNGSFWDDVPKHDANLVAAVEDQIKRAAEETDLLDPSMPVAQRIASLIERVHGRAIRNSIVDHAGYRSVGFDPHMIRRSNHPFRQALDVTDSGLLAIRIVCSGLGESSVRFNVKPPRPIKPARPSQDELHKKLTLGLSNKEISLDLGISARKVASARHRLRQNGRLPAFNSKRNTDG